MNNAELWMKKEDFNVVKCVKKRTQPVVIFFFYFKFVCTRRPVKPRVELQLLNLDQKLPLETSFTVYLCVTSLAGCLPSGSVWKPVWQNKVTREINRFMVGMIWSFRPEWLSLLSYDDDIIIIIVRNFIVIAKQPTRLDKRSYQSLRLDPQHTQNTTAAWFLSDKSQQNWQCVYMRVCALLLATYWVPKPLFHKPVLKIHHWKLLAWLHTYSPAPLFYFTHFNFFFELLMPVFYNSLRHTGTHTHTLFNTWK